MIPTRITDSDMIILQSVDSYIESQRIPTSQNPQEKLFVYQQARDFLYSDIVRRTPRVAAYILSADMENDTRAQGLNIALSHHLMDPVFVDILMQYLGKSGTADECRMTGAYIAKVLNKWVEQNTKEPEKPKKGEKPEPVKDPDMGPVQHMFAAAKQLLGNLANSIMFKCGNINEHQALAIAACVAMNNGDTIREIIESDMPITAQIFDDDIIKDPSALITAALLMDKSELPKLSENQSAFVESLKRWVYFKLNQIPTQTSYQFLVAAYGTTKPDVTTKVINPKECGTQYTNLFTVAKQLINQK